MGLSSLKNFSSNASECVEKYDYDKCDRYSCFVQWNSALKITENIFPRYHEAKITPTSYKRWEQYISTLQILGNAGRYKHCVMQQGSDDCFHWIRLRVFRLKHLNCPQHKIKWLHGEVIAVLWKPWKDFLLHHFLLLTSTLPTLEVRSRK